MKVSKRQSTQEVDRALRAYGPIKRYASLEAAGINIASLPVTPTQIAEVDKWRDRINRVLVAKAKLHVHVKDVHGDRFNIDEYLDGDPECFRRLVTKRRSAPIKIGINVSADYSSWELNAMRGGAILAFTDLLKRQSRPYSIEVCYGNGRERAMCGECHVRIQIAPYTNTLTHVALSTQTIREVGEKCVRPLAQSAQRNGRWSGFYRLHEYERLGIKEFDVVLDRVETPDVLVEYNRIVNRLIALGLTD